ncbi:MAG: response regulator [Elusimicrobia bacterium CG_4_10_14_0_2_um_filter_56_8]|nr:MAG: hypothetical protein AUJ51_10935 [Elusimicrobia bacterium CG1_02_56_21]PJA14300.1 MAG: response regulator [Elusimicrobia bacterium CG_4_10_14_0_2_um_filter_56_8]
MAHKILIVDDEVNVLFVVKQAFAGQVEVLTAQTGAAGLEIIQREKPSFVFLDIAMPGISGIKVLELIQGLDVSPVVWMLTGDEDLDTASQALAGGASGYLTKPFDLERLRGVVFNALLDLEKDRKETLNEDKPWHVKKPKK